MDYELFIALCVLWASSTWCLFTCAFMFCWNDGEGFHPHSVDMEHRHPLFQVVKSNTVCKVDFAVKSVSEYIAPRGSTSDKQLTVLIVIGAVAGFLGSLRWHSIGDATFLEASLCQAGCFSLLMVALFEVDVSSKLFLEEKLMITSWLLDLLDMKKYLNFSLHQYNPELLEFIRESHGIKSLYEEDDGKLKIIPPLFNLSILDFNFSMHLIGATSYAVLVTTSIILNEAHEQKVAWITGSSFLLFGIIGYLTGSYIPVFSCFKGWILLWNPFLREKNFLIKLQEAVNDYCMKRKFLEDNQHRVTTVQVEQQKQPLHEPHQSGDTDEILSLSPSLHTPTSTPMRRKSRAYSASPGVVTRSMMRRRKSKGSLEMAGEKADAAVLMSPETRTHVESKNKNTMEDSEDFVISREEMVINANRLLASHRCIRWALQHPAAYLKGLSHIMMIVELISLMTPLIALGIQWITALCGSTPPITALLSVLYIAGECVYFGDYECVALQASCIMGRDSHERGL